MHNTYRRATPHISTTARVLTVSPRKGKGHPNPKFGHFLAWNATQKPQKKLLLAIIYCQYCNCNALYRYWGLGGVSFEINPSPLYHATRANRGPPQWPNLTFLLSRITCEGVSRATITFFLIGLEVRFYKCHLHLRPDPTKALNKGRSTIKHMAIY
jgi:hypothetical protein